MTTTQTINNAIALARSRASELQTAAAHDGRYDDGGAAHLRGLIDAYVAGTRGAVPPFLEPFMKQAEDEADPEYAKYLELRRKFGGQ